jgi:hypothetical protein
MELGSSTNPNDTATETLAAADIEKGCCLEAEDPTTPRSSVVIGI